jgi:hypothetical protein
MKTSHLESAAPHAAPPEDDPSYTSMLRPMDIASLPPSLERPRPGINNQLSPSRTAKAPHVLHPGATLATTVVHDGPFRQGPCQHLLTHDLPFRVPASASAGHRQADQRPDPKNKEERKKKADSRRHAAHSGRREGARRIPRINTTTNTLSASSRQ